MSHNIAKLNGKYPDNSGNIPLSVSDLTDVSSVSDGQALVYDDTSGNWIGATAGGGAVSGLDFAVFGQGETNDYSNNGFTLTDGSIWGFYDTNPTNNIATHLTFNYVSGTSWLESMTFAAGTYEIFVQSHAEWSASGYLGLQLIDDSLTPLHEQVLLGSALPADIAHASSINHTFTFSAPTNVAVSISTSINLAASQLTTPSKRGLIMVRQVA